MQDVDMDLILADLEIMKDLHKLQSKDIWIHDTSASTKKGIINIRKDKSYSGKVGISGKVMKNMYSFDSRNFLQ